MNQWMQFIEIKYLKIFHIFSLCGPHPKSFSLLYFLSSFTHALSLPLSSLLVFFFLNLWLFIWFYSQIQIHLTTLWKIFSKSYRTLSPYIVCLFHLFSLSAQHWKHKRINFNLQNWSLPKHSSNASLIRKPYDYACLLTTKLLPNCVFTSIWFGINQFVLHCIRTFTSNLIPRSNW